MRDGARERVVVGAYTVPDTEAVDRTGAHGLVAHATSSLLPVLGVVPQRGRFFGPDEDRMGVGTPVAVIGDAFWRSRYGADSSIVGQPIDVELQRYTIIGVGPKDFSGADLTRTDVWLPVSTLSNAVLAGVPWYEHWRAAFFVHVVARLPENGTATQPWLTSLATTVIRRGEAANVSPGADTTQTILAAPILESLGPSITPSVQNAITVRLLGVTLILLLIAYANVANLLITRAMRRRGEIAIRIALGIGRGRLVAQLLTESVLLSLVAALVSILPAIWGASVLRGLLLPGVPINGALLDTRILAVAIALAVCGGAAAGVLPAIRARNFDIIGDMKVGASKGSRRRPTVRGSLVVAQAALSVLLLVGAAVFVESLHGVKRIDLGYRADRLVYGTVAFRDSVTHRVDQFWEIGRAERTGGLLVAAGEIGRAPGVEAVALSGARPMRGYSMVGLSRADGSPLPRLANRDPAAMWVSAEYATVTGIRLARGRFFTAGEQAGGAAVMVVNEIAAKAYWPNKEPLGQCIVFTPTQGRCSSIVGVTRNPHLHKFIEEPTAQLFFPLQRPTVVIARAAAGQSRQVAKEMTTVLRRTFPSAEPPEITVMEDALEPELRPWRLGSTLFSLFGGLALLITSIGLYSVVAYSVSERTREIGIRSALGARPSVLIGSVLRDGLEPILAGFIAGMVLVRLLWAAVAAMVYQAQPTEPAVIATVVALLLGTATAATIIPALRAARVDVVRALRAD